MEENKNEQTQYTGEYGNPVERHEFSQEEVASEVNAREITSEADSTDAGTVTEGTYNVASDPGEAKEPEVQHNEENPKQENSGYGYFQGDQNKNTESFQYNRQQVVEPKKENTFGKKLMGCAAMAAVFGIVAALCFQLVRVGTDGLIGRRTQNVRIQSTSENNRTRHSKENQNNKNVSSNAAASDVSGIVEQTMPAIVAITSTSQASNYYDLFGNEYAGRETASAGSGFIIAQNDKELLIATNNHVIDNAKTISVKFIDEQVCEASVKGTDAANDLAVIAVNISKMKQDTLNKIRVAELGSSEDIKVGEMAVAIGNALGYGQSVTVGYISAKNREIETSDELGRSGNKIKAIQTDAAINPGNSGGALINMKGQVIGINSAKIASSSVEGVGYAIPTSVAEPIINELMSREQLSDDDMGYLGITGEDVSDAMSAYNMPKGVYIAEVAKGGAADKAGLKEGNIITSINKMEVRTMESLKEKINSYRKGTKVEIEAQVMDQGGYKIKKFTATLQGKDSLNTLSNSNNSSKSGNSGNSGNNGNSNKNNDRYGNNNDDFGGFGSFFGY